MSNTARYDELLNLTGMMLAKYERLVTLLNEETALKRSHRAYLPVRDKLDILCKDAETTIPDLKEKLRMLIVEKNREELGDHDILALDGRYFIMHRDFLQGIYEQLHDLIDYIGEASVMVWPEDDDGGKTEV